uniref:Zinc knuckle family protein n=1 Tax=Solanum tuberosum TaxID=4113 RepID=M1C2X5_SOLTU
MLMYATICKSVNNTDRTICKMIIAGFTGQLRGWWDNYMTIDSKAAVINAKAASEGVDNLGFALVKNREDAVYTLVLTILEHFSGRFTNQYETIRSLLNGLRCRHLGEFRWYKDTYLSRVMELPENGLEYWKAKFIDGLPPLFAERVKKTLRDPQGIIPYHNFTYGKLIGACTQEGINLCNELKLSRQLKMDKLRERSQLGDFCTQFGLPDASKGTPFINAIYPFTNINAKGFSATYKDRDISYTFITEPVSRDINALIEMKQKHMNYLQLEIFSMNISDTLKNTKVQEKIKLISEQMAIDICADHPSAFWNRKKHIVTLPYEDDFSEENIPTKSRPCQMNSELVEFCKKEIDNLLQKRLIKPSKSPWSCTAFYVNNAAEKERGVPRMEPPWVTKGRGRGRGRSSSVVSSRSSYGSSLSSSTPIIQRGGMSLVKLNSKAQEKPSSSIHLEDIPESDPLYAKLQEYINQKQSNTFAAIAKDDTIDDMKTYEKVEKREMIFLLENSDIQRREEPWKIFQRYLLNGLFFPGESYKTRKYYETLLISSGVEFQHFAGYNTAENVYNFSKMIIKQIIHIEDWGISSMTERQISLNGVKMSFTYWDYIQAFDKVLCYNNERHKHTWFIKVCAKIFANPIPNWFLNWWSYHGPTIKILPEPFLKLYKEWVKISPDLNRLYQQEHISYLQQIEQICFFIEFSVPWIHKWVPEVDFTEEQIPCLYRSYYNNFWDKLMKKDPQTKSIYGQELLDQITATIKEYKSIPNKGIITDESVTVKHMARRISNHDEEEQNKMILDYLEEVKKSLLLNLNQYAKSDSSMRSEASEDMHEAQQIEDEDPADTLKRAEELLAKLKEKA